MLVNFSSTLGAYWIFLGQKNLIDFSPPFNPYFIVRLTSQRYNGPLKVLPEGSMVEYLSVGSQKAPKPLLPPKKFQAPDPKAQSQPSVRCFNPLTFYSTLGRPDKKSLLDVLGASSLAI